MAIQFERPAAFAPFFTDSVKIVAPRPDDRTVRGTFAASVNPIAYEDPFAATDAANELRRFSVLIANQGESAWLEAAIGSRPQIGDEVTVLNGIKTKIVKVSPIVNSWWELEVREC